MLMDLIDGLDNHLPQVENIIHLNIISRQTKMLLGIGGTFGATILVIYYYFKHLHDFIMT